MLLAEDAFWPREIPISILLAVESCLIPKKWIYDYPVSSYSSSLKVLLQHLIHFLRAGYIKPTTFAIAGNIIIQKFIRISSARNEISLYLRILCSYFLNAIPEQMVASGCVD